MTGPETTLLSNPNSKGSFNAGSVGQTTYSNCTFPLLYHTGPSSTGPMLIWQQPHVIWMAEVRWQRSPGFFFDLSKPFGPEEVRAAWHRVVDFNGAGAPEEDGTLGPHSPQLQQVMQGPTPSKL